MLDFFARIFRPTLRTVPTEVQGIRLVLTISRTSTPQATLHTQGQDRIMFREGGARACHLLLARRLT